MLRWTAIIGSVLLIVIGVWMLISPDGNLQHPYRVGAAGVLIGALTLATVLGSSLAGRSLALLVGVFIIYDFISKAANFNNQQSITDSTGWQEMLQATGSLLIFAIPCFLYVANFKNASIRYGCVAYAIYVALMIPFALAMIFGLRGWQRALFYMPVLLIVIVLVVTCIRDFVRDRRRDWRMNPQSYGHWTYEERIGNEWQTIQLECTGDHREPPISILLPRLSAWENFPSWSRERHAEIMQRIVGRLNDPSLTLIDPETNLPVPKLK